MLAALGVQPGDKVGVMDWDSHRYLESYFAVPMMGAVLQTVNVRLSPEQILYTINHAGRCAACSSGLPAADRRDARADADRQAVSSCSPTTTRLTPDFFAGEYEALMRAASPDYEFPDFDENTRATTFYTTGTTGVPKGVYFSHRQLVLHTITGMAALCAAAVSGQRFHRGDVYMPITPMFHVHAWGMPYIATMLGVKQVYPGRYVPDALVRPDPREKASRSRIASDHPADAAHASRRREDASISADWKVVIGGAALPQGLARAALDRGIDVFAGYGMSETCPLLTISRS